MNRLESLLQMHHTTLNKKTSYEAMQTLDKKLADLLGTQVAFFTPNTMQAGKLISEAAFRP